MNDIVTVAVAYLQASWRELRGRDDGATAIEWAIFALLALAVGGTVAAAITAYVDGKASSIK